MITSINVFNRYIVTNKYHNGFVTWDPSNRVAYGNFAIIHIMNILRDQILLEKMKMIDVVDIDFEKLKSISAEDDLLVIEFVDIISNALKDDREMTDDEKTRMETISKELKMTEEFILECFHQIYINSYK